MRAPSFATLPTETWEDFGPKVGSIDLTQLYLALSSAVVRRFYGSLSWALLALMVAVALVPANRLTVVHSHDDAHHDHHVDVSHSDNDCELRGVHHDAEPHAHQVGWNQLQKASGHRELGAPVLLRHPGLIVLVSVVLTPPSPNLFRSSAESALVHAPPPLLRSMAFLI